MRGRTGVGADGSGGAGAGVASCMSESFVSCPFGEIHFQLATCNEVGVNIKNGKCSYSCARECEGVCVCATWLTDCAQLPFWLQSSEGVGFLGFLVVGFAIV